ncbi:MAG: hypothetical protein ACXU7H_03755 [Burkholderiaceae bacterium]
MKNIKLLCGLIFLIGIGISISAAAHPGQAYGSHYHGGYHGHFHHGSRVGIVIGGPLWWPEWSGYYAPYYPYPPVVTIPVSPPVYIEQPQASISASTSQSAYWYYCDNPQGYFPYVRQCTTDWKRVAPFPSSQ